MRSYVVGRMGIRGIGNDMCAELLPLSQENVSAVTWSHSHIIIRGRFLIFFFGKLSYTVGMSCHFWTVDKTTAIAPESCLIGGL